MARKIIGTQRADRIQQGGNINNTELRVFSLGGNDTIILDRDDDFGGRNFVDAGSGNDRVVSLKEDGNTIKLGKGNDLYASTGFGSFASERADTVRAGAGNDTIAVSTFKSKYFGDGGKDTFFSVGQQNTFNGGSGIDSISYLPRDDDNVVGGTGVSIDLGAGLAQTGSSRFEKLVSIENASGTNVRDVIFGSKGANVLNGLRGDDDIAGRAGKDMLVGGLGQDVLRGDGGGDRFDFNLKTESVAGASRDVILDFTRNEGDRIDLRDIDASAKQGGNQAFKFIGGSDFSGKAGQLRFDDGIVSADINGDRAADFSIDVRGPSTMFSGDFLL